MDEPKRPVGARRLKLYVAQDDTGQGAMHLISLPWVLELPQEAWASSPREGATFTKTQLDEVIVRIRYWNRVVVEADE